MKFLTIRQPWASLIAVGTKTLETRPFSTTYRGPLAIHAGMKRPDFARMKALIADRAEVWERWYLAGRTQPGPMLIDESSSLDCIPLGAVVAVCDLVDVVPITDAMLYEHAAEWTTASERAYLRRRHEHGITDSVVTGQLPFGDFTIGRYAWILANVRPIDPVPMKGAQGLRDVPDDIAALLEVEQ